LYEIIPYTFYFSAAFVQKGAFEIYMEDVKPTIPFQIYSENVTPKGIFFEIY